MANVSKVGFNSIQLAKQQGKKLMNVRLNDGSSAKVLWNDRHIDCYIVKRGKILGGTGEGFRPENFPERMGVLLERLQSYSSENVFDSFASGMLRNVK